MLNTIRLLKSNMAYLCIVACACCYSNLAFSQLFIEVTNPQNLNGELINTCEPVPDIFQIEILNNQSPGTGTTVSNIEITAAMLAGLEFVPGSIVNLAAAGVVPTSELNISDLTNPIFTVVALEPGERALFQFEVIANCDAIQTSADLAVAGADTNFDVLVAFDGGNMPPSNTGNFSISKPSVTILNNINPIAPPVTLGTVFSKDVTIANGGQGILDKLFYYVYFHDGIQLDSLTINGNIITAPDFYIANDTGYLCIDSTMIFDYATDADGDPYTFGLGDQLVITEHYHVYECNEDAESLHSIYWGCADEVCELGQRPSFVKYGVLAPDLVYANANAECGLPNYYSCPIEGAERIYRIINQGSATATNFRTRMYAHNVRENSVDTSAIFYSEGKTGSKIKLTPTSAYSHPSHQACLGGTPIYWAEITLPIDIEVGDTIYIHARQTSCCDETICSQTYESQYFGFYNRNYEGPCGFYKGRDGSSNPWYRRRAYIRESALTPTDINEGQKQTNTYTLTGYENSILTGSVNDWCNDCYYEFQFVLGEGLDWGGTAADMTWTDPQGDTWAPDNISYTDNNGGPDTLIVQYEGPLPAGFSPLNSEQAMCYVSDCGEVPECSCLFTTPVTKSSYLIQDPYCDSCIGNPITLTCPHSTNITLHCPCCEPCIGLVNTAFTGNRGNYGYPDLDNNGIPDTNVPYPDAATAAANGVKIKTVTEGDIIEVVHEGYVRTQPDTLPNFDYAYANLILPNSNFIPSGAEVTIYDASANAYYSCTNVTQTQVGNTITADVSPSSLIANGCALPAGFTYEDSDSIFTTQLVKIDYNIGATVIDLDLNNSYFVSDVPYPSNDRRFWCNPFRDRLQLIGHRWISDYGRDQTYNGCEIDQMALVTTQEVGNSRWGNFFPNEVRPLFVPTEQTFEIPTGYLVNQVLYRMYVKQSNANAGYRAVGDKYFYPGDPELLIQNDSLYIFNEAIAQGCNVDTIDESYQLNTYVYLQPTCLVPDESTQDSQWSTTFGYNDDQFTYTEQFYNEENLSYVTFHAPSFLVQGFDATSITQSVCWDLSVLNTASDANAEHVFLYVESPTGLISIDSIVEVTGGSNTTLNYNNDIYEVGGLATLQERDFQICGEFLGCDIDSIVIKLGWDCPDYPSSINSYPCPLIEEVLYVYPQPAEIQIATIIEPDVTDVCTVESYEIRILSAKETHLYNVELLMNMPPGMTIIPGSAFLEYPENTTPDTAIPVTDFINVYGNFLELDVSSQHPLLQTNGLAGLQSQDLNELFIKFDVQTDCDYIAGSQIKFFASADKPCGEAVNSVFSPADLLPVEGVEQDYRMSIDVNGEPINPCIGSVGTIDISLQNLGDFDLNPVLTGSNDTVSIELPFGVEYAGNYVTKTNAINTPPLIETNNGIQTLSWPIQSGVNQYEYIEFCFDVTSSNQALDCGSSIVQVTTDTKSGNETVCVATGEVCDIKVVTGSDFFELPIIKPDVVINTFDACIVALPPNQEMIIFETTIQNFGEPVANDSLIILDVYADLDVNSQLTASDALLGSTATSGPIPTGAIVTVRDTFIVNAGQACSLIAMTDKTSCICDPSTILSKNNKYDTQIPDTTLCSLQTKNIGSDPINGYTYQWYAIGTSPISALSSTTISNPTFQYPNFTGAILPYEYLVELNNGSCLMTDTVKVDLYPFIEIEILGDTAFCVNQDTLDGGLNPLTGQPFYNYSWSLNGIDLNVHTQTFIPYTSGVYGLMVENAQGCVGLDSINVNFLNEFCPAPGVEIKQLDCTPE